MSRGEKIIDVWLSMFDTMKPYSGRMELRLRDARRVTRRKRMIPRHDYQQAVSVIVT